MKFIALTAAILFMPVAAEANCNYNHPCWGNQGYTTNNSNGSWSHTTINPYGGSTTNNSDGSWSYTAPQHDWTRNPSDPRW
jgi:hypothetical protein